MVENRADNELFHLITDTGIASQIDMPPGHACVMMGQYMAEFHNTLISAYNAAYSQALGVKSGSQDAADLLLYCQIICELTHEHHDWEEKCYFPAIGQFSGEPDIMGSNVEEHGAFEHSLGEFNAWVLETKKEDYDGQKLKMLLEALVPTLGQHFQSEPPTFYRLKHLDSDGLKAVFDRAAKIALDASDPWRYVLVMDWRSEAMKLTLTAGMHLSYSVARIQRVLSMAKSDSCFMKLRSLRRIWSTMSSDGATLVRGDLTLSTCLVDQGHWSLDLPGRNYAFRGSKLILNALSPKARRIVDLTMTTDPS
jgi:hypothetical protein